MEKTKILLTGASGTVGFQVLRQLLESGDLYNISILDKRTRLSQKHLLPYQRKLRLLWGDLCNASFVNKACQGQDVVIHLAAIIPPLADSNPKLAYAVNVEGTKNLVKALELSSKPMFLLYSSSISVYGDRLQQPYIKVSDCLQPSLGDEYAKTKIEAEKIIQASTLNWTIFRLCAIFGTQNHKLSKLMFHMPLETPIEFTTPEDAARAFVKAISKVDVLNKRVLNLGGGSQCRILYSDFLTRSFRIFGLGKLDFPEHSFAEQNFHCGYYADGDDLEAILSFRQSNVASYFHSLTGSVSGVQKLVTRLVHPFVKRQLTIQSEPYQAVKTKDAHHLKRFFKTTTINEIVDEIG